MLKNLSSLLEKIEAKFPDDKDVMELASLMKEDEVSAEGEEGMEDELEINIGSEVEPSSSEEPMDLASLLGEDLSEEEPEEEMEMPAKKKKPAKPMF